MHQFITKHLLFLGLFLYSSLIWGPVPGGFGSGNKEQYITKNMIVYSVLAYFVGMSATYLLLCMDYLPWTIAENPFTSELDVLDLVAVMLVIFGTRVRLSAFSSLKDMFTAQVSIKENHKLITTGPYTTIRHPSYLGTLMALVGLSILLHMSTYGYLIEAAGLMLLPLRIKNEERALKKEFGKEYEKWRSHTFYMIPYVI